MMSEIMKKPGYAGDLHYQTWLRHLALCVWLAFCDLCTFPAFRVRRHWGRYFVCSASRILVVALRLSLPSPLLLLLLHNTCRQPLVLSSEKAQDTPNVVFLITTDRGQTLAHSPSIFPKSPSCDPIFCSLLRVWQHPSLPSQPSRQRVRSSSLAQEASSSSKVRQQYTYGLNLD